MITRNNYLNFPVFYLFPYLGDDVIEVKQIVVGEKPKTGDFVRKDKMGKIRSFITLADEAFAFFIKRIMVFQKLFLFEI